MCISELEEGPMDLLSCLRNLAFQLALDGEVSQIAHLRRDICVRVGADEATCSRIWKQALQAASESQCSSSEARVHFASRVAYSLVSPQLLH
ncbi:hypothetical protein [Xanthomonas sacchari]|uniref:hypothetical protein n=1 Tax=Xanthomonas sacchari TaxID=56458 RepID=UPI00225E0174|nr:hypothetical protein [Xanthomonas sacchari]